MNDRNLIQQPPTVPSDYSYRGPQEVHLEPVGKPLPDRLAAAHERTRRHNQNDHSQCDAQGCAIIAEVERKRLAR